MELSDLNDHKRWIVHFGVFLYSYAVLWRGWMGLNRTLNIWLNSLGVFQSQPQMDGKRKKGKHQRHWYNPSLMYVFAFYYFVYNPTIVIVGVVEMNVEHFNCQKRLAACCPKNSFQFNSIYCERKGVKLFVFDFQSFWIVVVPSMYVKHVNIIICRIMPMLAKERHHHR